VILSKKIDLKTECYQAVVTLTLQNCIHVVWCDCMQFLYSNVPMFIQSRGSMHWADRVGKNARHFFILKITVFVLTTGVDVRRSTGNSPMLARRTHFPQPESVLVDESERAAEKFRSSCRCLDGRIQQVLLRQDWS